MDIYLVVTGPELGVNSNLHERFSTNPAEIGKIGC